MFDTVDEVPGVPMLHPCGWPWPWPWIAISRAAPLDRLSGNGGINLPTASRRINPQAPSLDSCGKMPLGSFRNLPVHRWIASQ